MKLGHQEATTYAAAQNLRSAWKAMDAIDAPELTLSKIASHIAAVRAAHRAKSAQSVTGKACMRLVLDTNILGSAGTCLDQQGLPFSVLCLLGGEAAVD